MSTKALAGIHPALFNDEYSDIADLFLNTGTSAYPYREPRISTVEYQIELPPLQLHVPHAPSDYKPRGGGTEADWRVWDPRKLLPSVVDEYVEFGQSLCSAFSQEYLLTLLRDCDYDLTQAKSLLTEPVLNESNHSSDNQEEPHVLPADKVWFKKPLNRNHVVGTPWSYVDVTRADHVPESLQSSKLKAFVEHKKSYDQSELDARREEIHRIFDIGCDLVKFKPQSNHNNNISFEPDQPTDGDQSPSGRMLSTPVPTESEEIDIFILRHVIQSLADIISDDDAAASSVLSQLQSYLDYFNTWLERVRPLLLSISKNKDSVSLAVLEELVKSADYAAPDVTNASKKKLVKVIAQVRQWRDSHAHLYRQARLCGLSSDNEAPSQPWPTESRIPFSLLAQLVRDGEKACGSVFVDELGFYRESLEICKKFQAAVETCIVKASKQSSHDDVVKLSVARAEEVLNRVARYVPFVEMEEIHLVEDAIKASKSWVESVRTALASLDAHDETAVDKYRALLDSSSTLALEQPMMETLKSQLELKLWLASVESTYGSAEQGGFKGPLLDRLRKLLLEGKALKADSQHPLFKKLEDHVSRGEAVVSRARQSLRQRSTLEQFEALLNEMDQLPVSMPEEDKVSKIINNTNEWHTTTKKLLSPIFNTSRASQEGNFPGEQLHAISLDIVDSQINRSAGKNVAVIAPESLELTILRLLSKCGKHFTSETKSCLNVLRVSGGGKDLLSSEYREKPIRRERESCLSQVEALLEQYQSIPALDQISRSTFTTLLQEAHGSSSIQPVDISVDAAVLSESSNKSLDTAFLKKGKLAYADFVHAVALLDLPLSLKIKEKLDEVQELIEAGSKTSNGEDGLLLLSDLSDLIFHLRRSGVAEDSEPLLTLTRRHDTGVLWQKSLMSVLPVGSIPLEAVRKTKPKKRVFRKKTRAIAEKQPSPPSPLPVDGDEPQDKTMPQADDQLVNEQTVVETNNQLNTTTEMMSDEEEVEQLPESSSSDEYEYVPAVAPHPPAPFRELTRLFHEYYCHTKDGIPLDHLPEPVESNARLDLVQLPELKYLVESIGACRVWQDDARHARQQLDAGELDDESLGVLINRGQLLGTIMPELAELEVAAWSQQWRKQVASQLDGTLELSAGISLLRQLKSRFPTLYHPLYSVQSEMEQEQKRTDTFLAEIDEQDSKAEEQESLSLFDTDVNEVVTSGQVDEYAMDVAMPESTPLLSADAVMPPDSPSLSTLQLGPSALENDNDMPPSPKEISSLSTKITRTESNSTNSIEALFLQSVMSDVRALESRVLGEYTWLKRVYSVFHRRFGSMASFLTRVTLGMEPPSLRMLIEDSDVSIEQLAGTQSPAVKPKKRRGGRQSAANQAATEAAPVTAADAIDESQVDFSLIYCYCKRPALENEPMVACDQCKQWFHHHCLNLSKEDQKRLDNPRATFVCPECAKKTNAPYQYREKTPNMKKRINGVRRLVVQRLIEAAPVQSSSEQRRRLVSMFSEGQEWTDRCKQLLQSVEHQSDDKSSLIQQLEVQVKDEFAKWQQIRNRICEKRRQVLEKRIEDMTATRKQKPSSKPSTKTASARSKSNSVKQEPVHSVKQEPIDPVVKSEPQEPSVKLHSEVEVSLQVCIRPCPPGSHDLVTVRVVPVDVSSGSVDCDINITLASVKVEKAEKTPRKGGRGGRRRQSSHEDPVPHDEDTDLEMIDSEYQQMLESELAVRRQLLLQRATYADDLQAVLRAGLSLPFEFEERFAVERRVRLVLALERAERVMLENSFAVRAQESLSLLFGKHHSDDQSAPLVEEGNKSGIDKATRKNELKHLSELHVLLSKCDATSYLESDMNQNITIHRFNEWFAALIELNQSLIKQLTITSTANSPALPFNQFFDCQTTFKLRFAALSLPSFIETNMRVTAIVRWLPKERRSILKKLRASALNELLSDRFKEVGNIHTNYTEIIVAKLSQVEQWNERLEAAIEDKQGPQAFQSLLAEVDTADLLVDESDTEIAKQYTQLYCLCQRPYEDGIFMVGCDHCEDWFHPDCVNLKGVALKKIKTFQCPRCCVAQKLPYQYGSLEQFNIKPPAPPTPEPEKSPVKPEVVKKDKTERDREKAERKARKEQKAQLKLEKAAAKTAKANKHTSDSSGSSGSPSVPDPTANGQPSADGSKSKRSKKKKDKDKKKDGASGSSPAAESTATNPDGLPVEVKKKKKRKHRDGNGDADVKSDEESSKKRKKKYYDDSSSDSKHRKRSSKHSANHMHMAIAANAAAAAATQTGGQPSSSSPPAPSPVPQTAQLYASLLYEQFSPLVTPDNATILWHLLSGYTDRPFSQMLMAEINEAIQIVVSEQLFTQIQPSFMQRYTAASNAAIEEANAAATKASPVSSSQSSPITTERDSSRVKSKKKKREKRSREPAESIAVSSEDERVSTKKKKKVARVSSGSSRIWPVSHRRSPTPARTAFDFFVVFVHTHRRAELAMLQAHAGEEAQTQKGITKLLQSQWKRLTSEEKAPFETEARLDRERYAREQQAYQISLSTGSTGSLLGNVSTSLPSLKSSSSKSSSDSSPKLPPSIGSVASLPSTVSSAARLQNGGSYSYHSFSQPEPTRPHRSSASNNSYNSNYHHSHSIPMASAIYPGHQQMIMHHHPHHLMNMPTLVPMIMPNQNQGHIVYVLPQQAMQQQQQQQQQQQIAQQQQTLQTSQPENAVDKIKSATAAVDTPDSKMDLTVTPALKRDESTDEKTSTTSSLSSILSPPLSHLTLHPQFSGSQISPLLTASGSGQPVSNYIILQSNSQSSSQSNVTPSPSENGIATSHIHQVPTNIESVKTDLTPSSAAACADTNAKVGSSEIL